MTYITLQELVYETVHRAPEPVPVLADKLGISANYLYKMGIPHENGADFKLKHAVPLMQETKNYKILKKMNQLCGFLPPVKVPRVARNKTEDAALVAEYQQVCHQAVNALIDYLEDPRDPETRDRVIESLQEVASHSIGVSKRVQHDSQIGLFDE